MTSALVVTAALLQGLCMFVDEIFFHRKRELPGWERWGHPVDTVFFLLPLSLTALLPATPLWVALYIGLSVVSSLVITKDEWVHAKECAPGEHWIHALLFVLHPCVLIGTAELWLSGDALWFRQGFPSVIVVFASYQFIFLRSSKAAVNNSFYDTLGTRWYEDDAHAIALLRVESRQKLKYVREIFASSNVSMKARILDIGCGAGFVSNPLAREGYSVKGIDLSASSVEVAREHAPPGANITYEAQNAYSLQEADASYDVVLMLDFLEHVDEPDRAVREAARVLKPGGLLLFHTFNRTPISNLLAVHGIRFVTKDCPSHVHVYSLFLKPKELQTIGESSGLSIAGWRGIRPKIDFAFFSSLWRRRIHPDFGFTFSSSLGVGYLGYFSKAD